MIEGLERKERFRLLLHSCCACSSYVLEYLSRYFAITLFYFNPNIYPHRVSGAHRGAGAADPGDGVRRGAGNSVEFQGGEYEPEEFYRAVRGHEETGKGRALFICYELRLRRAARAAVEEVRLFYHHAVHQPPEKCRKAQRDRGAAGRRVRRALSDVRFQEKNGYKRSTELSAWCSLYRQDYCGCVFSREARRGRTDAGQNAGGGRL